MKKLTDKQKQVLLGLKKYGGWQRRCGWRCNWSEQSTFEICESLVKKGYAIKTGALFTATDKEVTE